MPALAWSGPCQERHGRGHGAPPVSGHQRRDSPHAPARPQHPSFPSPPSSTHASPGEAPDGGRADAPGASRRTDHALCRRGPPVSASSAERTGPSPGMDRRAPPVPPPSQRPATVATTRGRHLAAALTTATARAPYKSAAPAPFLRRTTSPTPSSTPCPSLESGGAAPRRNRIHPNRTDLRPIHTPQPP